MRLTAEHYHGAMLAEDSPGRRWFCGTRGHRPETLEKLRAGAATDGLLEFLKGQGFEVIVTAKDLWTLFNRYCANQHIRNPFENPTSLGARISNDRDIMRKGGWEYVNQKPGQPHYKKIQGNWHWRFRRSLRTP